MRVSGDNSRDRRVANERVDRDHADSSPQQLDSQQLEPPSMQDTSELESFVTLSSTNNRYEIGQSLLLAKMLVKDNIGILYTSNNLPKSCPYPEERLKRMLELLETVNFILAESNSNRTSVSVGKDKVILPNCENQAKPEIQLAKHIVRALARYVDPLSAKLKTADEAKRKQLMQQIAINADCLTSLLGTVNAPFSLAQSKSEDSIAELLVLSDAEKQKIEQQTSEFISRQLKARSVRGEDEVVYSPELSKLKKLLSEDYSSKRRKIEALSSVHLYFKNAFDQVNLIRNAEERRASLKPKLLDVFNSIADVYRTKEAIYFGKEASNQLAITDVEQIIKFTCENFKSYILAKPAGYHDLSRWHSDIVEASRNLSMRELISFTRLPRTIGLINSALNNMIINEQEAEKYRSHASSGAGLKAGLALALEHSIEPNADLVVNVGGKALSLGFSNSAETTSQSLEFNLINFANSANALNFTEEDGFADPKAIKSAMRELIAKESVETFLNSAPAELVLTLEEGLNLTDEKANEFYAYLIQQFLDKPHYDSSIADMWKTKCKSKKFLDLEFEQNNLEQATALFFGALFSASLGEHNQKSTLEQKLVQQCLQLGQKYKTSMFKAILVAKEQFDNYLKNKEQVAQKQSVEAKAKLHSSAKQSGSAEVTSAVQEAYTPAQFFKLHPLKIGASFSALSYRICNCFPYIPDTKIIGSWQLDQCKNFYLALVTGKYSEKTDSEFAKFAFKSILKEVHDDAVQRNYGKEYLEVFQGIFRNISNLRDLLLEGSYSENKVLENIQNLYIGIEEVLSKKAIEKESREKNVEKTLGEILVVLKEVRDQVKQ